MPQWWNISTEKHPAPTKWRNNSSSSSVYSKTSVLNTPPKKGQAQSSLVYINSSSLLNGLKKQWKDSEKQTSRRSHFIKPLSGHLHKLLVRSSSLLSPFLQHAGKRMHEGYINDALRPCPLFIWTRPQMLIKAQNISS